jgi:hypothetical protein
MPGSTRHGRSMRAALRIAEAVIERSDTQMLGPMALTTKRTELHHHARCGQRACRRLGPSANLINSWPSKSEECLAKVARTGRKVVAGGSQELEQTNRRHGRCGRRRSVDRGRHVDRDSRLAPPATVHGLVYPGTVPTERGLSAVASARNSCWRASARRAHARSREIRAPSPQISVVPRD